MPLATYTGWNLRAPRPASATGSSTSSEPSRRSHRRARARSPPATRARRSSERYADRDGVSARVRRRDRGAGARRVRAGRGRAGAARSRRAAVERALRHRPRRWQGGRRRSSRRPHEAIRRRARRGAAHHRRARRRSRIPATPASGVERGVEQVNNSGQVGTVTLFDRGAEHARRGRASRAPMPGRVQSVRIYRGPSCDDFGTGGPRISSPT